MEHARVEEEVVCACLVQCQSVRSTRAGEQEREKVGVPERFAGSARFFSVPVSALYEIEYHLHCAQTRARERVSSRATKAEGDGARSPAPAHAAPEPRLARPADSPALQVAARPAATPSKPVQPSRQLPLASTLIAPTVSRPSPPSSASAAVCKVLWAVWWTGGPAGGRSTVEGVVLLIVSSGLPPRRLCSSGTCTEPLQRASH